MKPRTERNLHRTLAVLLTASAIGCSRNEIARSATPEAAPFVAETTTEPKVESFFSHELGLSVQWRKVRGGRIEMRAPSSAYGRYEGLEIAEWMEMSAAEDYIRAELARRAGFKRYEDSAPSRVVERSSYTDEDKNVRVEWRRLTDGTTEYRLPIAWLRHSEHPGAWVTRAQFESRRKTAEPVYYYPERVPN